MAKKLLANHMGAGKRLGEGGLMEERLQLGIECLVMACAMMVVLPLPAMQAFAQTLPTAPQATVDTTMPPITGNTYTVNAGGNLQTTLNQAAAADPNKNYLIVLQAGATFTGPFTLPVRGVGTGWVILRSSAIGSLPPEGTRVKLSDASNMPKIVVGAGVGGAIQTAAQAHHFRFVGVEIKPVANNFVYALVELGSGETALSALPHDIIFDRCYLHGDPTQGTRRGIALNAASVAVIDSYLSAFAEVGADSQAIAGWNGPGPFKIVNNYLEGAGENVMFGGAGANITNLSPSDIEIRNNYFFKPLSWKVDDPTYAGIHWSVKNLFELKHAKRVLVEGNVFENNWADAQVGFAILFTPRGEGYMSWAGVQDVTFRKNIIRHSASGVDISGEDDTGPSVQTSRILLKDNLFEDINRTQFGGDGRIFQIVTPNRPTIDLTIDHNTAFHVGGGSAFGVMGDSTAVAQNFAFTNNMVTRGDYGFSGSGAGEGLSAFSQYLVNYTFQKNVIIGNAGVASSYPAGNFFPESISNVGLVNYSGGDYHLSASSPYKNAGTDGRDPGSDIDALQAATACVVGGVCGTSPNLDTIPPAAPTRLRMR